MQELNGFVRVYNYQPTVQDEELRVVRQMGENYFIHRLSPLVFTELTLVLPSTPSLCHLKKWILRSKIERDALCSICSNARSCCDAWWCHLRSDLFIAIHKVPLLALQCLVC